MAFVYERPLGILLKIYQQVLYRRSRPSIDTEAKKIPFPDM